MIYKNYLNEKYTSEMTSVFKMYLKDIAETLRDANISVEDAEFTEIELPKPVAISTIERAVKEQWRRGTYSYTPDRSVVAIMKHVSGGVSIGSFSGKGRLSAMSIVKEFGDTDSKVSAVFVTEADEHQIRKLSILRHDRERANAPVRDRHNISKSIHKRLSMMENPAIKEITKKAKVLGFGNNGPIVVRTAKYDESGNEYYLVISNCRWESERWIPGVPHCDIVLREPSYGDNEGKADDYVKVNFDFNASTFSFNSGENTPQQFANAKKKLDEIFDMIENAKKLADIISSYTYGELYVEV